MTNYNGDGPRGCSGACNEGRACDCAAAGSDRVYFYLGGVVLSIAALVIILAVAAGKVQV